MESEFGWLDILVLKWGGFLGMVCQQDEKKNVWLITVQNIL